MDKNLKKQNRDEVLNYQKQLHYELLILNEQEKGLNDELSSKLRAYSTILANHLNWEVQDQYLKLLREFTEKKINTFTFQIRFTERFESIEKVANLLELNRICLSPNKNCLNFGEVLADIYNFCQSYSDDPEPFRTKFDIGEAQFTTLMEKSYLEIKNILNEE